MFSSAFMFYSSIMCQKYWAKNMEAQEFCSLIASQLYRRLVIHFFYQWKLAVNRWALTRAAEDGLEQNTLLAQQILEKRQLSLFVNEHSSCWTVDIKTGICLSFELGSKSRKWLSQWGDPCLHIFSRRCLLLVQRLAFKTWRKARFSKFPISNKEHSRTVC